MDMALWTDARLDALREVGDPPADEAVAALDMPGSLTKTGKLLMTLVHSDNSILRSQQEKLPRPIVDFVKANFALPPWADVKKIERGQDLFKMHGPAALAALLCASLPECYSHKKGAQVLWYTQNLEKHTVRRVYHTAMIVMDVMQRGGLVEGGDGVLTTMKTRLLHAAMRRLIVSRPPSRPKEHGARSLAERVEHSTWNPAWGAPINQEDSIFTLLTFSYVILRSWDAMGVYLTRAQREGYLHCWNVVGYYLGIPEAYMVHTQEDAKKAFTILQRRQQAASVEGTKLNESLLKVIMEIIPDKKLAEHIDHTLMRVLVGKETAAVLGLPKPDLTDQLFLLGYETSRLARATVELFQQVVIGLTGIPREGSALDDLGVRLGAAITRVLVSLVGRGTKGFSLAEIGKRASELATTAGEAKDPLATEAKQVLSAEGRRLHLASQLGIYLVRSLQDGDGAPPLPTSEPSKEGRPSAPGGASPDASDATATQTEAEPGDDADGAIDAMDDADGAIDGADDADGDVDGADGDVDGAIAGGDGPHGHGAAPDEAPPEPAAPRRRAYVVAADLLAAWKLSPP